MTYKRQTETENLLGTPRYERENNSWQRSNEKSIASTSTIFFLENGALTFTRCIEIFLDLSISLHPFSQRLDRARASTVAQWKMHVETLGNQLDRRSVNGRVGKDFLSLSLSLAFRVRSVILPEMPFRGAIVSWLPSHLADHCNHRMPDRTEPRRRVTWFRAITRSRLSSCREMRREKRERKIIRDYVLSSAFRKLFSRREKTISPLFRDASLAPFLAGKKN